MGGLSMFFEELPAQAGRHPATGEHVGYRLDINTFNGEMWLELTPVTVGEKFDPPYRVSLPAAKAVQLMDAIHSGLVRIGHLR
jgi:hypothetical protein